MSERIGWKVHTPSLLRETLTNPGTAILAQPFRIFGQLLAEVATRAAEIDDPKLNILMMRLTLYEQADPEKFTTAEIDAAYADQMRRAVREGAPG